MDSHKKSIVSEFKSFIDNRETKHKWNEFLITKGVQKVMEEIKDISHLKKFLKKGGIETSHQYIKKFQSKLINSKFSDTYVLTVGELYNEIHSKFYGSHEDYLDDSNSLDAPRLVFPLGVR